MENKHEIKINPTRRIQGEDKFLSNSHRDRRTRRISEESQPEPLGISRAARKGKHSTRSGSTIAGGILSQLINEYREQKAIKLAEIERLDERIEYFEGLLAELEQRTEENP